MYPYDYLIDYDRFIGYLPKVDFSNKNSDFISDLLQITDDEIAILQKAVKQAAQLLQYSMQPADPAEGDVVSLDAFDLAMYDIATLEWE